MMNTHVRPDIMGTHIPGKSINYYNKLQQMHSDRPGTEYQSGPGRETTILAGTGVAVLGRAVDLRYFYFQIKQLESSKKYIVYAVLFILNNFNC